MSKPAQQIDFTFGSIEVNLAGFLSVYAALLTRVQSGYGIDIEIGTIPAGAAAAYFSDDNMYRFPSATYGMTVEERSAIVHESVHAMRDIKGATFFLPGRGMAMPTATEDEGAAYVAGALYHLYDTTAPPKGKDPVFVKAYSIAKSIMNVRGAVVPASDVMALRTIVAADPLYQNIQVTLWSQSRADSLGSLPTWLR
jgi:hypothetical protein